MIFSRSKFPGHELDRFLENSSNFISNFQFWGRDRIPRNTTEFVKYYFWTKYFILDEFSRNRSSS